MKFQNYWGYISAADTNYEQVVNMCELLFKHVGEFREHTSSHFCKIVDRMHEPKNDDKDMLPLDPKSLNDDDFKVFMDEDDNSLYFTNSGL